MRAAVLFVSMAGLCVAQQLSDFAGTWVMKVEGKPIFKLTLTLEQRGMTGALVRPERMTINQDGDVTDIAPGKVTMTVEKAQIESGGLALTLDGDAMTMAAEEADRATLTIPGMRPWKLERVPAGSTVVLATSVPQPAFPAEIRALRERIKSMVKADQEARLAFDDTRMLAADEKNRPELLAIFEKYGWPAASLIGKDAAHDYWLLVQHQTPEIMQRVLPEMEKAAKAGQASMSDYAYLYDRVQTGLGKPQRWGSQVRCEGGQPALYPVDDPAGLDERRKQLSMMPIGEYLKMEYIVRSCKERAK